VRKDRKAHRKEEHKQLEATPRDMRRLQRTSSVTEVLHDFHSEKFAHERKGGNKPQASRPAALEKDEVLISKKRGQTGGRRGGESTIMSFSWGRFPTTKKSILNRMCPRLTERMLGSRFYLTINREPGLINMGLRQRQHPKEEKNLRERRRTKQRREREDIHSEARATSVRRWQG